MLKFVAATLLAVVLAGCGESSVPPTIPMIAPAEIPPRIIKESTESRDSRPRVALLVGEKGNLTDADRRVRNHLRVRYVVRVWDDNEPLPATPVDAVVMSKTVLSTAVGNQLHDFPGGVVFWEDNQQMLSMMATIDNDGSGGTGWHGASATIHVEPGALISEGLSGMVALYTQSAQMTWSPAGQLAPGAIRVAEFQWDGDGRHVIYAYETGTTLADGTAAAGRRVYFGLYDATFLILTDDGVSLFDAAVEWAVD